MFENDKGIYIQDPDSGIVYVKYLPSAEDSPFLPLCMFTAPHPNLVTVEWLVDDVLAKYNLDGVRGLMGLSDE